MLLCVQKSYFVVWDSITANLIGSNAFNQFQQWLLLLLMPDQAIVQIHL